MDEAQESESDSDEEDESMTIQIAVQMKMQIKVNEAVSDDQPKYCVRFSADDESKFNVAIAAQQLTTTVLQFAVDDQSFAWSK